MAGGRTTSPFPVRQFLVLAICRISEPIAFMGIFPYIYFMIEDFHFTSDANTISVYAGMVTSAFTFAEFFTGVFWGRLSDKIGRKPVLLTGLVGTAISVTVFGFSTNLYMALAARAIGGLLNGNMGVLQSTVTELVATNKEHQPRAYTIMPVVWCLGSILGPMIGGALAKPCETFPNLFARGTIWEVYPYLLPNLLSASLCVIGVVNGLLFLQETHSAKKQSRDRGLEVGNWILSKVSRSDSSGVSSSPYGSKYDEWSETQPLLDEPLPGYQTSESSPQNSPRLATAGPSDEPSESLHLDAFADFEPSRKIFTQPVILNVVSFGILAFHTMTFDSLFPTFLSTPHPDDKKSMSLPFKFADGLALEQGTIGFILSAQGIYSLIINVFVVPHIIHRFGALRVFRFLALAYFLLYLVTPYVVLLPERYQIFGIYLLLIWKCTFASMAYPSNAMLTANSAPSQTALGSINGAAASTASLCRGFGPMVSGFLYAVGMRTGYSGLAWWCSALVTIGGAVVAVRIPEQKAISEKGRADIEAQPVPTATA